MFPAQGIIAKLTGLNVGAFGLNAEALAFNFDEVAGGADGLTGVVAPLEVEALGAAVGSRFLFLFGSNGGIFWIVIRIGAPFCGPAAPGFAAALGDEAPETGEAAPGLAPAGVALLPGPPLNGGMGGTMEALLATLELAEIGAGGGTTIVLGMGRAPAGGGMATPIVRALLSPASLAAFSTIAFCLSPSFARMGTRSSGMVCFNCMAELLAGVVGEHIASTNLKALAKFNEFTQPLVLLVLHKRLLLLRHPFLFAADKVPEASDDA